MTEFLDALIARAPHWRPYLEHPFVEQLGAGTLPESCFRRYLIQDYLFLGQFARAYGLAAFKADRIEDVRRSAALLDALINEETRLHVDYCAKFGLSEADLERAREHPSTIAYTRYVVERGVVGDFLELLCALAPCVIGYGSIGERLARAGVAADHPYRAWIETYAGEPYQAVAREAAAQLEAVAARTLGPMASAPRIDALAHTFDTACMLEVDFWAMGLDG